MNATNPNRFEYFLVQRILQLLNAARIAELGNCGVSYTVDALKLCRRSVSRFPRFAPRRFATLPPPRTGLKGLLFCLEAGGSLIALVARRAYDGNQRQTWHDPFQSIAIQRLGQRST